ncbi:hypothetical protein K504DRAFT_533299 [Pleomassaria siparia CBS 279.74]|uniref:Uncharacterized protein n=1 Tax=Pleomassaria siparia CBS 279.74 TaxID=1314801 RepID=A0A6G1KBZ7_9PLEO|nr:hypothetical protein K504DRAFT_533299 [Pleomassaria siparia CBS 279.74]
MVTRSNTTSNMYNVLQEVLDDAGSDHSSTSDNTVTQSPHKKGKAPAVASIDTPPVPVHFAVTPALHNLFAGTSANRLTAAIQSHGSNLPPAQPAHLAATVTNSAPDGPRSSPALDLLSSSLMATHLGLSSSSASKAYGSASSNGPPASSQLSSSNNAGVIGEKRTAKQVPSPQAGTKPRILLEAPLQMIRTQAGRIGKLAPVAEFIERVFPYRSGRVTQQDPYIPQVVYKVEYDVADEDWKTYAHVMHVFGFAAAIHEVVGEQGFDQTSAAWWAQSGIMVGHELEDLLSEMVKHNRLGYTYELSKPWESAEGRAGPAPR